jgi:hypothetical protein
MKRREFVTLRTCRSKRLNLKTARALGLTVSKRQLS